MLYYYCRNIPNGQPDFPNMLILQKLGGLTTPPIPPLATALTPGQWRGEDSGDSEEECRPGGEENDSLMFQYNEALSSLPEKVKVGKFTPLTFQLNTMWEEATQEEKEICIDKAMEGWKIVCEVIAPKAGD